VASPTGSNSLVALALLCAAGVARAEGPSDADRKLAQSLFDHARKMLEAGQIAAACPKFAESHRLDPGGGTLLNLALCHEREGKTASAWFEYNDALSLALKENRHDRELIARERLAALEPKLVRLSVAPASGADVEVPVLAPAPPPRATPPPPPRPKFELPPGMKLEPPPGAKFEAPPDPRYARIGVVERNPLVYVLGVTAGAGLLVGTVTGLSALARDREVTNQCRPERRYCSSKGIEAADSARSLAWASTLALGVGLAAAAIIPFVPPAVSSKRVRVGAGFAPGGVAVGVGGAF
jgi:hypothetical protein